MKKLILFLVICSLIPASESFAGGEEQVRAGGVTSFDGLLNKLTADYAKGLQTPAPAPAGQPSGDDRFWVTVIASGSGERTRLLEAGMDIVEIKGNKVSGTIPAELLPAFADKGVRLLEKEPLAAHLASREKDFPAADAAYHNYQEVTDLLRELASKNPDIASLFPIGRSVENRELWCLRINSSAKGETPSPKPGAVFLGTHHAREHLSTEVPLLFAAWLLEHRSEPEAAAYIQDLDIYVIPMLNPDGAEYDIAAGSYKWQRKNRHVNPDNSIGVDLNRNYDAWFGGAGTSHSPRSDTYCGPSSFSEPESAAFRDFILSRRNLRTMISYHSFSSLVLYPYGGADADVADARDLQAFKSIAQQMAALTGYRARKSSELYVATGDATDWVYDKAKILAFTIELEGGSFYPGAAVIEKTVKSNVKAASYLLSVTANPYTTKN